jgi:hypothetical protein
MPGRLTLKEIAAGTHYMWGWMGSSGYLEAVGQEKTLAVPGIEIRPSRA